MPSNTGRRDFLKHALAASAGGTMGFGFEERDLAERLQLAAADPVPQTAPKPLPMGKIKNLEVSRLICGGNLISGFAHSRDLIYVSSLLKHYFTDEKVIETLHLCEAQGINTAILRLDNDTLRILGKYWREAGGQMQWIAQIKPTPDDLKTDAARAVDNGAAAVYVQGGVGDAFVKKGRVDLLGEALEHFKDLGVPAGIGGHAIQVPMACEEAGLDPDFYMKTLNSKNYWSAGPQPRFDSVWAETPEKTIEFMAQVNKPWIGFKVLGAGAIHPRAGFRYAFENGADFICVGMFDFQVADDAEIARGALEKLEDRQRPWMA